MLKRRREITDLRGEFKKAESAAEILKENSEDAAANLTLGTYLCVIKDDWTGAAIHLAKCNVLGLKEAAELELAKPSEPAIQAELGDKWWKAAQRKRDEEQQAYLARAGHWYRQAHQQLTGLKKVEVTGRLRELNKQLNKRTLRPGFLVRLYNPLKSQQGPEPRLTGKENLGDPVGKPKVIETLDHWGYEPKYNAVATGYLRIDEPGKYTFNSDNSYDRNLLFLDGKLILGYRDMSRFVANLDIGLHSLVSVGTPEARGYVIVTWMPPGKKTLETIPPKLLFHKPPLP